MFNIYSTLFYLQADRPPWYPGKLNNHGNAISSQDPDPLENATPTKTNGTTAPETPSPTHVPVPSISSSSAPPDPQSIVKPIPQRIGKGRNHSTDTLPLQSGTPPQRRGSWFSNISSKFSVSPTIGQTSSPNALPQPDADDVSPLPKISPSKNAVLPHASRQSGDAPYVPAPPRTAQPGFLGVFRRLSSSSPVITPGTKANHGLVERRVLNVDKNRERCRVNELSQAKLRRVAFSVDVEIAPMPKYAEEENAGKKPADKAQRRKMTEKSEGEALKSPKVVEEQKESIGVIVSTGEALPKEPEKEGTEIISGVPMEDEAVQQEEPKVERETTRKKEKKKKSEAERKAKKERKRKEALEKGTIPMELYLDSDSSSEHVPKPTLTSRTQLVPTTNPGRIYRRCCQLRETDILTKVTLQLPKTTASCVDGIIEKLDLTGYYMSLPDLVTLGDFLAVVPVKEVLLENCGLTDEGVRVVLAGLLAAKKTNVRHRKSISKPADLTPQGGVVERLVLKNNKIGTEGWKHICLFIHMCHSIKWLDLSDLQFPAPTEPSRSPLAHHFHPAGSSSPGPPDLSLLLSKSIGERLAGPELELLNMGSTGLMANQLGALVDGVLKSRVARLGLAHNHLDAQGVQHVARYLRDGKCASIDLGGNDLREHLDIIAEAIDEKSELWAVSLADCNLKPASLCKLFRKLVKLPNLRFIDLSHNQDLFASEPSAIGLLRRYLPQMEKLRRLHLADVSLSSEQAIALAEILPEITTLAHINLLENPDLVELADAKTEEGQEEACALYASLMAAVRVSNTLFKVDIETPSPESVELVKALANRLVAYCMNNLQRVPDIPDSAGEDGQKLEKYPDILRHLVGHEDDDRQLVDVDDDYEPAPNEDYVIGGTGVVKALTCVLKTRGDDARRHSGELVREIENGTTVPRGRLPPGKAKDMSKHLLASARKIRVRLQPALTMAKASSREDMNNYQRLVFLDQTIEGIIQRFEDEFPETRQSTSEAAARDRTAPTGPERNSFSSAEVEPTLLSDGEEAETELRSSSRSHSQSNSIMSNSSKALVEEEAQVLRAGNRFRRGLIIQQEHYDLLTNLKDIRNDSNHVNAIMGLLDELEEDDPIRKEVQEKGPVQTFQEHREELVRRLREKDPQHWARFVESQEKATANVQAGADQTKSEAHPPITTDEEAISD
ncbi:RNI-like protein [Xylariaceae sp. FL0662B]|nr:RNI-like protein [Xylariaceae sp. FL0662B]